MRTITTISLLIVTAITGLSLYAMYLAVLFGVPLYIVYYLFFT